MGLGCITDCIWDCRRPPPLSRASENGLAIWLLDWKTNVQSPLTSNWTLATADVAESCLKYSAAEAFQKFCPFMNLSLCTAFISDCLRRIHINLIDMALQTELGLTLFAESVSAQNWSRAKSSISDPGRLHQTNLVHFLHFLHQLQQTDWWMRQGLINRYELIHI